MVERYLAGDEITGGTANGPYVAPTIYEVKACDIRVGTVTINCYGEGDASTPFGSYKHSGFGGRGTGIHAHDQYTKLKTIWIDLTDPTAGENVG